MAGNMFRQMRNPNTLRAAAAGVCKSNFGKFKRLYNGAGKATARVYRGQVDGFRELYDNRHIVFQDAKRAVSENRGPICAMLTGIAAANGAMFVLARESHRRVDGAREERNAEGKKLGKACEQFLEKVNGEGVNRPKEIIWEAEFRVWTMTQAGMKAGEIREEILSDAYMGDPELAQAMDIKELDRVIEGMGDYQVKHQACEEVCRETMPEFFTAAGVSLAISMAAFAIFYLAWTRGEKALAGLRGMLGRFRPRLLQGAGEAEGVREGKGMAHGDRAA